MKEVLELRINYNYSHLLFREKEGRNIGTSVKVIELLRDDPRYKQVPINEQEVRKKYGKPFFFAWKIKRSYSREELNAATLFHVKIKTIFEPAGEECGTLYDDTTACEICGVNRKQIGALILKRNSIPRKDIAKTIAGEVVVSKKFASAYKKWEMKGLYLEPVIINQ